MMSSVGMEIITTRMVEPMKVSTVVKRSMDMECLRGPMVFNMTGNIRTTKCMVKESKLGLTGANMRDNT